MIVKNIQLVEENNYCKLSAIVQFESANNLKDFELWFRIPREYSRFVSIQGDTFIAALLLPCMKLNEDLIIRGKVSRRLLESTDKIMDIYHAWDRKLVKIKISVDGFQDLKIDSSENACFFSGGVDSFYTLLKNIDRHPDDDGSITHLIFVHGFDIRLENNDLFDKVLHYIQRIAIHFNKKVLIIKTNLRVETSSFVKWGIYYGCALASIGLIFNEIFRKIYISAPDSYADLVPTGSHPILDPLWSTETLSFEHDGAECTRVEKILNKISKSAIALETLRVCWRNPNYEYNCGVCEKCLRTMIPLYICGVLDKCKFSNKEINLKKLRNIELDNNTANYFRESLDLLNGADNNKHLRAALITCLRRNGYYKKFAGLRKAINKFDEKSGKGIIKKIYRLIR